jgi:hypothetical protein
VRVQIQIRFNALEFDASIVPRNRSLCYSLVQFFFLSSVCFLIVDTRSFGFSSTTQMETSYSRLTIQDGSSRSDEPSEHVRNGQQRQAQASMTMGSRRKRCHGNRKRRCFKKKCRRRGLNEEEIVRLVSQHRRSHQERIQRTSHQTDAMEINNTTTDMETTSALNDVADGNTTTNSKKRKQMTSSSGQASNSQRPAKKRRSSQISFASIRSNYKLPMYMKTSPNILFQAVRLQIKHPLKRRGEQRFIHQRLQLIDRQARLQLRRSLWQSFFALGCERQVWPVSSRRSDNTHRMHPLHFRVQNHICKMAKSTEHQACEELVRKRLRRIQLECDQCAHELHIQSESRPVTLLPLESLDQKLKDLVHVQQKYLSIQMNAQLKQYRDAIHEKDLFQALSMDSLTVKQVRSFSSSLVQLNRSCFSSCHLCSFSCRKLPSSI